MTRGSTRRTKGAPAWLVALLALLFVAGLYYLWRGMIGFFENTARLSSTTVAQSNQTSTITPPAFLTNEPLNLLLSTPTPDRSCLQFRVSVVRARVRECPDNSCRTLEQPPQNALICVYGPAAPALSNQYPKATEWYEVNIAPEDPLPRLGFMHNSVIEAISPTKRPTRTAIPPPTVTAPAATRTPAETVFPLITVTPLPPAGESATPQIATPRDEYSSPTPTLPLKSA